jgi:cytochrome P450
MDVLQLLAGPSGDIYAAYDTLRAAGPVVRTPLGSIVLGHAEVEQCLREPSLGKHDSRGVDATTLVRQRVGLLLGTADEAEEPPPDVAAVLAASIVAGEGDHHLRRRRALLRILARWDSNRFAAMCQEEVRRCERNLLDAGSSDLVADFARPVAAGLLCSFLGLDEALAPTVERMSREVTRLVDPFASPGDPEVVAAIRALVELSDSVIDRADDDLGLTADEVHGLHLVLMVAGHQTILHSVGNAAALLAAPGAAPVVRSVPGSAVWNEVLRLDTPVQALGRVASQPLALGGQQIEADELLVLGIGAANRDEAVFADAATFDPGRAGVERHLAFGGGERACLGARIAQAVGPVLVDGLLGLLELVSLDQDAAVRFPSLNLRGFESLPVVAHTASTKEPA